MANQSDRNARILELHNQGLSNQEIAEVIGGITQQRVSQIICDTKYAGRNDGKYAEAADLFLDGYRFKEIGERLGVTAAQASMYVKRALSKDYVPQRILQYINRRVIENPITGCWEWQWNGKTHARPQIFWKGKYIIATRLLWFALYGQLPPKGIEVCHTCDNIICVNPDHLFLGTHKENMEDRDRKGRGRPHGKPSIQHL